MPLSRPIVNGLATAIMTYFAAVWTFGSHAVQDFMRSLAVAFGVTVATLYAPAAWKAITAQSAAPVDYVLVGIFSVATGYSLLFTWRLVSIELGDRAWMVDTPLIGLATTIMIFGAMCHLAAAGRWRDGPGTPLNMKAVLVGGMLIGVLALVLVMRAVF